MSEWRKINIGEFINIQRGHDLTNEERMQGNIPVFGAAGQNGFHNKAMTKGPGVLIGRSGGSFGQVHISKEDYWPHNTALYVTDFKGNDPFFVYYFLKILNFSSLNSGSAQPSLNRNFLYPLKIRVPEEKEQKAIGKLLSFLDDKIELNNKINDNLEQMAKTIYDYWFVQFDFPDKNGKPYKLSGGKMVWNEQLKREIPEGWKVESLDYIAEIIGGSTPSKDTEEYFTKIGGVSWITPKDLSLNKANKFITNGEINITEKGLQSASLRILPSGTVLMSSRAPIGYLAIASNETTTNQGFKSFVPFNDFPTEMVYYIIKNLLPTIINNASGSTFKEVSGSVLKSLKCYIPPKKVIENFKIIASPIFKEQEKLEKQNQELAALRDWLLPMLMNGQVTIGKTVK